LPTNIEIKAIVRDWERMCRAANSITDQPLKILEQEDTFFRCAKGRLKLRQFSDNHGELIAYQRADFAGTKSSSYSIAKTEDPIALRQALASSLGILGVVRKQRHLYMHGPTRIHLDKVEGLGTFAELEVVMKPGQPTAEGEELARDLMEKLEIRPEDLLAGAYLDLLAGQASAQSRKIHST
jgi:predicted adenylyl cyclase CyaB